MSTWYLPLSGGSTCLRFCFLGKHYSRSAPGKQHFDLIAGPIWLVNRPLTPWLLLITLLPYSCSDQFSPWGTIVTQSLKSKIRPLTCVISLFRCRKQKTWRGRVEKNKHFINFNCFFSLASKRFTSYTCHTLYLNLKVSLWVGFRAAVFIVCSPVALCMVKLNLITLGCLDNNSKHSQHWSVVF